MEWLRSRVGEGVLVLPTIDVIAMRDGKFLMVLNKDFEKWVFPGGYVERDDTWRESAARELLEEGGLSANPSDLQPIAIMSGKKHHLRYKNGDETQVFSVAFLADKFTSESDDFDKEEVGDKKWFTPDEIDNLELYPCHAELWAAYKNFVKTGEFQVAGESMI